MVHYFMLWLVIARLRGSADLGVTDSDAVEDQPDCRRMLAEAIVRKMHDAGSHLSGLIHRPPYLLRQSDILWLLRKLEEEEDEKRAALWTELIAHVFNPMAPGHLDAALLLCAKMPKLDAALKPFYEPVALNSDEATQLRKRYQEQKALVARMQRPRNSAPLDPPPAIRLEQHLSECEAGDSESWLNATFDLELASGEPEELFALEDDLTRLPGWSTADAMTRSRIIAGAPRFLNDHQAGLDWLGTHSTPFRALAGYRALLLLREEASELFRQLPAQVWEQWAPIVVSFYGARSTGESQEPHNDIARVCVQKAPKSVDDCLRKIISKMAVDKGHFVLPDFVKRAWNDVISQVLLELATSNALEPEKVGTLIDELLEHQFEEGARAAKSFLHLPVPASRDARRCAVLAAKALIRHSDDAGWDVVWPAMRSDRQFGRDVVEAVAVEDMHNASIVMRLSERDAAEFYVWIARQYPHNADPKRTGPFVSTRDAIAGYRDTVLRAIEHRGTTDAIEALLWIAAELPDAAWMKWVIASARQLTLQATWRPIAPADIINLTQSPNCSLVQNPADLQDVILESLMGLEALLQGETPAARDLWDKSKGGVFRPVDENDLSNYVKRYLEQDLKHRGIVALREVEIRRGEGEAEGERTDLHITGMVRGLKEGTFDQVRVIIEVKGAWHPDVDTAMETQLVDRYLRDNTCQHGIYLVGWYHCPQWDKESSSYKKSRKETHESSAERFAKQAAAMSKDGRRIRSFVLNAALR
jgi:hypothetical protein